MNPMENARVRRVCLLSQKSSARRVESEVTFYDKVWRRRSRAFTQSVLLYLAEASQLRHQRQARITKMTKMFRVQLDEAEQLQLIKQTRIQSSTKEEEKKEVKKKEVKKKVEEVEKQSVQRSLSNASEVSLSSSIEEATRRAKLFRRTRALSIGVIQESPGVMKRRLSAPEVVITPVLAPVLSRMSSEIESDLKTSSPPPESPPILDEEEEALPPTSPSTAFAQLGLGLPPDSASRSSSRSTFKSYSKTSPLMKRMGSHESSSGGKRRLQDLFTNEEVPNPVTDQRFVDLLFGLHVYSKKEEGKVASEPAVTKKPPN